MKKIFRITLIIAVFATKSLFVYTQTTHNIWPQVNAETHPWVRWWWMGSAVDKQNIELILSDFAAKGIGGVEIAPIYGAKGYESRYIQYLSPQWMEMLTLTTHKADSLGIGVDMTNGTGWPFGGPHVTINDAATKLTIQKYQLNGGEKLSTLIAINDSKQKKEGVKLQALTAYGADNEIIDITSNVDDNGLCDWTAPAGDWIIYAAFSAKTQQMVKRAAPGGKGYTFDHLSTNALNNYLARFDSAFANRQIHIRSFFNDSYEVFGASWTPKFFEEFQIRRHFDLKPFLRELNGDGDSVTIARIKSDYRETMSDMVLENFTINWTNWAHSKGALTKNQSHGSPANLLDLYATVDIPEIETFGSSEYPIPGFRRDSADVKYSDTDPLFQKFASSGAHVSGKNLVSCETFTWLREHFKGALSHCKPEVDQVFLSGVNHVFYHGATYSPADATWPGWLFYASVNFSASNSFWNHIEGLNSYITRCQSVLQTGSHTNDIMVYWPVYDIWNNANGLMQQFTVHNADSWLHMNQLRALMNKGYSFDFVSDRQINHTVVTDLGLLTAKTASPYKVLVIPDCRTMPLSTLKSIIKLANEGANVVVEKWPSEVSGYYNHEKSSDEMKQVIESLQFNDANELRICKTGKGSIIIAPGIEKGLQYFLMKREKLTDTGLKFVHRTSTNGDYYFLSNLTGSVISDYIPLNAMGKRAIIMNPLNGTYGVAKSKPIENGTCVNISLQPGESCIVLLTNNQTKIKDKWQYLKPDETKQIAINTPWTLTFKNGGPTLPAATQLDSLTYWTDLGDDQMNQFSGVGVYTTTFNISGSLASDYQLRLDNLRESALVIVNGHKAGIVWSLPYSINIGKYLKKGNNTISIEVANLMANRIRHLDQTGVVWRNYYEINFVNIAYKPFNASNWIVKPSGIKEPVILVPCSVKK